MIAMSEQDVLQLDQAARGCISGTLSEWPFLRLALARCGVNLPATARVREMQQASAECLDLSERSLAE